MTNLKREGFLQDLRGRLRGIWGELTDDDFDRANGNWDRLVGTIKQKTGESEESIRRRVEEIRGDR